MSASAALRSAIARKLLSPQLLCKKALALAACTSGARMARRGESSGRRGRMYDVERKKEKSVRKQNSTVFNTCSCCADLGGNRSRRMIGGAAFYTQAAGILVGDVPSPSPLLCLSTVYQTPTIAYCTSLGLKKINAKSMLHHYAKAATCRLARDAGPCRAVAARDQERDPSRALQHRVARSLAPTRDA